MTPLNDDTIDELLRAHFTVADDGFSAKVMQRLPRRRRFPAWGPMIGAILGVTACALCLFTETLLGAGGTPGMRGPNASAVVVWTAIATGLSLLAMGWAIAEET
jgi:hypothetical protein